MRARPSLSLLLSSLPALLSCASAPPAPAPPSPFLDSAAARQSEYGPVPPPTPDEPLSVHLSRHMVESLVFLDAKRVFLTNELGELFRSTDAGETWASVPGHRVRGLAVANRSELWAAGGGVSQHEPPAGFVMRSTDAGQSWTIVELEPEKVEDDAVFSRIPLAFVNHADEPPLLVMGDGAFVQPTGGRGFEQWPRLGTPGFSSLPRQAAVVAAAVDERGTLYAAATSESVVAMSSDRGKSWQRARLPVLAGSVGQLACGGDACFALAVEEPDATKVFRASAGTNAWTLVKAFEDRPFARVMVASGAVPAVMEFMVCGLAAMDDRVVFAGWGASDDYKSQWPATFTLAADGTLASSSPINAGEPRYGRDVVCELTRAPDGSLWALGRGAFRSEAGEWKRRWRYPGEERRE